MIPAAPRTVELWRVRARLRRAARSAHGDLAERESILIAWESDVGVVGWAECPTMSTTGYVTETTSAAWSALCQELVPAALVGRSPTPTGTPAATAALTDAALDARLRTEGVPLGEHLGRLAGAPPRASVPWCAVVAEVGAGAREAVAQALEGVARGASMVKVKVADAGAGASVLEAVVGAVGVPVAADANGSLDASGAESLDRLGLSYLEQPLPRGATWDELAALRARLRTPLALDESLTSLDAVRSALLAGAVDVVSVKPARMGGCRAAAAAASLAADNGARCFVGGMFELGVGRAAALAVAAQQACDLPTDLGPSDRYVAEEVCDPLVTDDEGRVLVPTGAGIGRTPSPSGVEVVEHVVLGT